MDIFSFSKNSGRGDFIPCRDWSWLCCDWFDWCLTLTQTIQEVYTSIVFNLPLSSTYIYIYMHDSNPLSHPNLVTSGYRLWVHLSDTIYVFDLSLMTQFFMFMQSYCRSRCSDVVIRSVIVNVDQSFFWSLLEGSKNSVTCFANLRRAEVERLTNC